MQAINAHAYLPGRRQWFQLYIYICCLCFWELAVNVLFLSSNYAHTVFYGCRQYEIYRYKCRVRYDTVQTAFCAAGKRIAALVLFQMVPFLRSTCRKGISHPFTVSPADLGESLYRLIEDTSVEMPQEDNKMDNWKSFSDFQGSNFSTSIGRKSLEATWRYPT